MKKNIIVAGFMMIGLLSCSKDHVEVKPYIPGTFRGEIGRHGFYLENDKSRKVIKTLDGDAQSIKFEFELDNSFDQFIIYNQLIVNLKDMKAETTYKRFLPYVGDNGVNENWITLITKDGNIGNENAKIYSTLQDRETFNVQIEKISELQSKVPAVQGSMKGYLFNVKNHKDSILVQASFLTEPFQ
ncbi:DUF5025 domain-containing protein [Sphingobacterium faecium]|uniref:DUF5025 domain-containing protein n=1 Tax=Sphingobacterium TaxID=28453 RepID=UPI0025EAB7F7|nr:DUF5025 domain-containing protein [Sphingobacterium sp. UBA6320]